MLMSVSTDIAIRISIAADLRSVKYVNEKSLKTFDLRLLISPIQFIKEFTGRLT